LGITVNYSAEDFICLHSRLYKNDLYCKTDDERMTGLAESCDCCSL